MTNNRIVTGTGHLTLEGVQSKIFGISIAAAPAVPAFALHALLDFGPYADDGRLIEAVAAPWYAILDVFERSPDEIYRIDPFKWEEIIAGAYKAAGYDEVTLTPRSGDGGRDVIATKFGVGSVRIFDQMKAYKPPHVVTADEVRAMLGVVTAHGNVSKGVITTTSVFAPRLLEDRAIASFVPFRLELKSRDELLAWLAQIRKRNSTQPSRENSR